MAPRNENLPNRAAEDTVFGNLGLEREDLGLSNDDLGSGNEGDDLGSGQDDLNLDGGQDDLNLDGGQDGQDGQDRSRVTHTEPDPANRFYAKAEVKPDKNGNLVDANGKIVARRGSEARLYQAAHQARGQAQTLTGQLNEANTRLKRAVEIGQGLHRDLLAARAQNDAVKQFGIEPAEQLTAFRLYKGLIDEPAKTIKNILTRAAANGINIAELGLTGGVDAKSLIDVIRQEIGSAVNPLKERTAAEQAKAREDAVLQQRRDEIQSEMEGFFTENPEARQFIPVFTQTIQKFPKMTLGEVWAKIQLIQLQNPSAFRRRADQNSQRGRNGSRPRSLPNGRPIPASNGQDEMAPVNESYENIIRKAMDDVGMVR